MIDLLPELGLIAVIDFEKDEGLDIKKYGSSWPWNGGKPLCCSVVEPYSETKEIYRDWELLKERLKDVKTIVCHNVMYDMGVLMQLGVDISEKFIIDTMVLIYLYNSNMERSLGSALKAFFNDTKSDKPMALYALRHRLYTKGFLQRTCRSRSKARRKWINQYGNVTAVAIKKRDGTDAYKKPPPFGRIRTKKAAEKLIKQVITWTKRNMGLMYSKCPELVEMYCIDDSVGTGRIFKHLINGTDKNLVELFNYVFHGLLKARRRGVRTDNKQTQHARDLLFMKELDAARAIYKEFNKTFDKDQYLESFKKGYKGFKITSQQTLVSFLMAKGYKPEYDTSTKRYSIDHAWMTAMMEQTNDPIFDAVLKHRKYFTARNHFCDKIIAFNKLMGTWDLPYGRIYPQINVFGADASGRMSASCPNIQQMPSMDKDKEIGALVRGVFVPEEGEIWYSMDWMAQEPRLHVHFGVAQGIESAISLATRWKQDPKMDIHMEVAADCFPHLVGEELKPKRKQCKIVNLAIAYGEGEKKTIEQELKVSWQEGKDFLNIYLTKYPYIKQQSSELMMEFKNMGFITTLLNRKIMCPKSYFDHKTKKWKDLSFKAFNFRIQGSGADMCYTSIALAEMCNIPILFPVHDEINASLKSIDEAKKLKYIMEKGLALHVPMVVEVGAGKSWADACINEVEL